MKTNINKIWDNGEKFYEWEIIELQSNGPFFPCWVKLATGAKKTKWEAEEEAREIKKQLKQRRD